MKRMPWEDIGLSETFGPPQAPVAVVAPPAPAPAGSQAVCYCCSRFPEASHALCASLGGACSDNGESLRKGGDTKGGDTKGDGSRAKALVLGIGSR